LDTPHASWMIRLATSYPGAALPAMMHTRGVIFRRCSALDDAMTA